MKFGYTGAFTAAPYGLVAATIESRTVLDDPTDGSCSLTAPNAQLHPVVVAAGTTYARFSLFDEFTDGDDDIDLCVYRGTTLVGSSGSGTSAEEVSVVNPTAGNYTVVVHGWGTDGPDAQYALFLSLIHIYYPHSTRFPTRFPLWSESVVSRRESIRISSCVNLSRCGGAELPSKGDNVPNE